jgi:hypothetical protein
MSEETAREIAEREIRRPDEKRKTPERRSNRSGSGRRGPDASKARSRGTDAGNHRQKPGGSTESVGKSVIHNPANSALKETER